MLKLQAFHTNTWYDAQRKLNFPRISFSAVTQRRLNILPVSKASLFFAASLLHSDFQWLSSDKFSGCLDAVEHFQSRLLQKQPGLGGNWLGMLSLLPDTVPCLSSLVLPLGYLRAGRLVYVSRETFVAKGVFFLQECSFFGLPPAEGAANIFYRQC